MSINARQLIFPQAQRVDYVEYALPPPTGRQVLARTRVTGISQGTEMAAFTGASPFNEKLFTGDRIFVNKQPGEAPFFPFWYAGYDAVGIVEAVGLEASGVKAGDRVWAPARHQTAFVSDEYLVLPAHVSDDDAIMLNLASIALAATNDAAIHLGDVVAVFGGGTVGQLVAQMAFLRGARRVFLVEPVAERRAFAAARSAVEPIDPAPGVPVLQLRAANGGAWPDAVIECSGAVPGLRDAIQAAGVGGTVVAAGFYAGPATALVLGEEFLHNRVTIQASMSVWGCPARQGGKWDHARALREALHLIAARRLRLEGFIGERLPFAEGQRAYDWLRAEPGRFMKLALLYGEGA